MLWIYRFKENVLEVETKTKQNKTLFCLKWLASVIGVLTLAYLPPSPFLPGVLLTRVCGDACRPPWQLALAGLSPWVTRAGDGARAVKEEV